MNEGDTYKFIDEEKTYRVMSNIKDLREYFSSEDEDSILEYYNEKKGVIHMYTKQPKKLMILNILDILHLL